MKTVFLSTVVGLVLYNGIASADLNCVNYDTGAKLTVAQDKASGTSSIHLEQQVLNGQSAGVTSQEVIQLNPFGGDKLTIMKAPKHCPIHSRVPCDDFQEVISADLSMNQAHSIFSCSETAN